MIFTQKFDRKLIGTARRICEIEGWGTTNLRLQKLLYICHMVCLGRLGRPLISQNFEAWTYGPVVPVLYHILKIYGAEPINEIRLRHGEKPSPEEDAIIQEVCGLLKEATGGQLVSLTHKEGGAWSRNYNGGSSGNIIKTDDIINEYRERFAG